MGALINLKFLHVQRKNIGLLLPQENSATSCPLRISESIIFSPSWPIELYIEPQRE